MMWINLGRFLAPPPQTFKASPGILGCQFSTLDHIFESKGKEEGNKEGGVPPYFLPVCLCSQKYGQVPKTNILVCLEKP